MISRATRSFWQAHEGLNATQKGRRDASLLCSCRIPDTIRFDSKNFAITPDYLAVRVSRDVRVVDKRYGDTRPWIGTHDEFDKLFS